MGNFFKKLPEQAVRIVVLFVVLAVVLLLVRQFILPPSLKDPVLQKASATEREAAREIKYAGAQICTGCHEKQHDVKASGYHRDLTCDPATVLRKSTRKIRRRLNRPRRRSGTTAGTVTLTFFTADGIPSD